MFPFRVDSLRISRLDLFTEQVIAGKWCAGSKLQFQHPG
jgi:hypothetical protein